MPRRSSFSSRSNSNSRSSQSRALPRQAPQPAKNIAPADTKPGMMSGMMGTIFQGMAFGAGSEVAHQAVRGAMGTNHAPAATAAAESAQSSAQAGGAKCSMENENLVNCLKFHTNNISACQDYMSILKQCETPL